VGKRRWHGRNTFAIEFRAGASRTRRLILHEQRVAGDVALRG
jgi:hypothetical protein